MFRLNITKQLFWFVSAFIIFSHLLVTTYLYKQTQDLIELRAYSRATSLESYFLSMRYVYHQQFLNSGFEIDDKTVGFLPAHASTLISDVFSKKVKDGISIRNVSDNPRNPKNKANEFEQNAIKYFQQNPDSKSTMTTIKEDNQEMFFYASPIKIEAYCISCHGKKEEVLPYVSKRYDTAFGYKEGDIRGITSIKIPKKTLNDDTMAIFWSNTAFNWSVMLVLLASIYYVIRELTIKDVQAKEMLQSEVNKKTADLQKTTDDLKISNEKQKQLFSVLRTVADCNQILITTSSIDELISKTAHSMHLNKAFSGVKIILEENGELVVKESLGLDEEFEVYPLEEKVFKENQPLFMDSFEGEVPQQCLNKIRKYNIKEVYMIPLVKDTFATEALGVITVCSTLKEGLSQEEVGMIKELAGDMGFAINSFLQKELIKKLSYYDMLTNLPNKRFLLQQLEKSIHNSAMSKQFGAVLHINFDDFKSVNNIKGLSAGDKILQEMSQRLIDTIHHNEMIFRVGGDEFIVLLENIGTYSNNALVESQKVALEVLGTVKEPFIVDNQNFYMTLGIGIVLFKEYTTSVDELLNNVESAMHIAKKSGKNSISFYDSKLQEVAISRSMMMQNLKDALVKNEFFVLYQKQVNKKGEIVGAEVLVRWQHPVLGIVSPSTFIPIAEESGFILELGEWIFIQSIKELLKWQTDDMRKDWRMSINISPLQFKNSSFVSSLVQIVKEHNISPNKIRLELTEGILVDNALAVASKIKELKEFGFSISIDDFGTGYSSLAYLKNLPIDELKIDQSFVANLHMDEADQTIVKTIISMGEAFGLDILAEGVETKEQFEILKLMGCKYFQGFLFAKPKSALELV